MCEMYVSEYIQHIADVMMMMIIEHHNVTIRNLYNRNKEREILTTVFHTHTHTQNHTMEKVISSGQLNPLAIVVW